MMKKNLALALALVMCLAAAAEGNTAIFHQNDGNDGDYSYLDRFATDGEKIFYFYGNNDGYHFCVYDIASGETKEFPADGLYSAESYPELRPTPVTNGFEDDDEDDEDEDEDDEDITESGNEFFSADVISMFAADGECYLLMSVSYYTDRSCLTSGGLIYRADTSDGSLRMAKSDFARLDWSGMTETYGAYTYSRGANGSFYMDGELFLMTYGDVGPEIRRFDLATGDCEVLPADNAQFMAPAGNGEILLGCFNYDDPAASGVLLMNVNTGEKKPVSGPEFKEYDDLPTCVASDGTNLYFIKNGEIWACSGYDMNTAVSVNTAPMNVWNNAMVKISADGRMIIGSNELDIRSLDPNQRANVTLRVCDYAYCWSAEQAAGRLSSANPDVEVVLVREYTTENEVITAMMNKSSATDVYILNMSDKQYNALYSRGYLADLSGSEKLTALTERMYPAFREASLRDGKTAAMPVDAWGYTMGYNAETAEKVGLKPEDLPTTWDGYLTFLETTVPAVLAEHPEIRAFSYDMCAEDMRYELLMDLITAYEGCHPDGSFTDSEITALAERIDKLDYSALGLKKRAEMNGGIRLYAAAAEVDYEVDLAVEEPVTDMVSVVSPYEYDSRPGLLTSSASININLFNNEMPLLLSFDNGVCCAALSCTVAIVNPYTVHPQEAVAFIETLMDCLQNSVTYTMFTDMTEPIRPSGMEEYKQYLLDDIANLTEELSKLDEDDEGYETILSSLEYFQNEYDNVEETYWEISPAQIESYRSFAPKLRVKGYSYLDNIGLEESDYEEMDRLISLYDSGEGDSKEILAFLDRKLRMMRLEDQ